VRPMDREGVGASVKDSSYCVLFLDGRNGNAASRSSTRSNCARYHMVPSITYHNIFSLGTIVSLSYRLGYVAVSRGYLEYLFG
jgi:hypothetical protein